ncbi:MAG: hypothetical protein LBB23_04200 [Rickettsiales bacterium]|jgi:hypothetical protein|nr:hypothetical protein [Rickettsiales bacterium]
MFIEINRKPGADNMYDEIDIKCGNYESNGVGQKVFVYAHQYPTTRPEPRTITLCSDTEIMKVVLDEAGIVNILRMARVR